MRFITIFFALFLMTITIGCNNAKDDQLKALEEKVQALEKKKAVAAKPAPKPAAQAPAAAEEKTAAETGKVTIYENKNYSGRRLNISFRRNISDLNQVKFNDIASSARFEIPKGWAVVLYEDSGFKKPVRTLRGTGAVRHFAAFTDKCSSVRWIKQ